MANPGDTVIMTTGTGFLGGCDTGTSPCTPRGGKYQVLDSIEIQPANVAAYPIWITGDHMALLNVKIGPASTNIPGAAYGLLVTPTGDYVLLYRSYIHDIGSPDNSQNGGGQGGFPVYAGSYGTYWSNHSTRGGHDGFIAKDGAQYNKVLNNVFDGGWGMGFETVHLDSGEATSNYNLFEGNVIAHVAQLSGWEKPGFEISSGHNTIRRNVVFGHAKTSLEISFFSGGTHNASVDGSNLVYNNTFSGGNLAYFQNNGTGLTTPFDGTLVTNNIFVEFSGAGTIIYRDNNTTDALAYNVLRPSSGNTNSPYFYTWCLDCPGTYMNDNACPDDHSGANCSPHGTMGHCDAFYGQGYKQTLTYMESCFSTVWNHNLSSDPLFVDSAYFDFHLQGGSPSRAAGTRITDPTWAFPPALGTAVDLGAFGLRP